ncbi:hypothetical protein ABZT06_26250 [Streptomyces sp. NPDC005483]|uniref:hypothetical protein n=1 Tax=Streptomyces sp. NPDC005483 TaxID=3154882 RepID=UPI0033AAB8B9
MNEPEFAPSRILDAREFVAMTREILDPESVARERAADEVTDLLSSYSSTQVSTLATLLSAVAACEKGNSALEAELHAILELMSTGHVAFGHVAQLQDIRLKELSPELREYVTDLLDG